MGVTSLEPLLHWIGLAAVAVCAITGVLDSARKNTDLIGAMFVGVATALGGGTLRDLLLARPVFWVADQIYLVIALLAALATFVAARRRTIPPRLFLLPDAVGLALFTIVGTQIALQWQAPWLVASLLGVITGAFGGVVRDILLNDVPTVFLQGELYASAAWLGAVLLILLQHQGVPSALAAAAGMGAILALRLLALRYRLMLPTLGRQQP